MGNATSHGSPSREREQNFVHCNSRYGFSSATGLCKGLRVERIETKISGIDWKLKLSKNSSN